MTAPHVVLTHDGGSEAGLGHQRRMEALGAALRDRGVRCSLVAIGEFRPPADVVVVDSYVVRADDDQLFAGAPIVAIDDLERDLAVDLVVDPNPSPSPAAHQHAGRSLLGPRYALVGPVPPGLNPAPLGSEVETVVVTLGAGGAHGLAAEVAERIAAGLPEARVQVVVGVGITWPLRSAEAIETAEGLLTHLAAADLVVTAGGVTLLEALLLGRPTLAVATAANQRRAVRAAVDGDAAAGVVGELSSAAVTTAALKLAADPGRRLDLAAAARTFVDDGGPARVSEAILALL